MSYATAVEMTIWFGIALLALGLQMILNIVTPPMSRLPGMLTLGAGALLLAIIRATV